MAGQPSPIKNPHVVEGILSVKRKLRSDKLACDTVGICQGTLVEWKRRAKEAEDQEIENEYSIFLIQYKKACAEGIESKLEMLENFIPDNWQALAWLLERTTPEQFGRYGARSTFNFKSTTPADRIEEVLKMISQGEISSDEGTKLVSIFTSANSLEFQNMVTNELQLIKDELNRFKAPKPEEDKDD